MSTPKCRCGANPPHTFDMPVIFIRGDHFYPSVGSECTDWANYAAINPGTTAIKAVDETRLWPADAS